MSEYHGPDDQVETVFYPLAKKRPNLSLDLFDRYWKDVHGPTCARLPHLWQYTQFHVDHDDTGIWRVPEGVEQYTPPEEQIDGFAELTFLSQEDSQRWLDAAGVLARDEQNVFGECVVYQVTEGRSKTYVDNIGNGTPNGDIGAARFHVMLKKHPEVTTAQLRRYLTETFAPNVARHPLVLKLRLHLIDDYTAEWDSADVDNLVGPERTIQAAFEIAFQSRLELAQFLHSEEYEAAIQDQVQYVRQVSVFPEREAYAMIQEGKATLLGLRGASVAKTITEAGAVTNLYDDVVELFTGGTEA